MIKKKKLKKLKESIRGLFPSIKKKIKKKKKKQQQQQQH